MTRRSWTCGRALRILDAQRRAAAIGARTARREVFAGVRKC